MKSILHLISEFSIMQKILSAKSLRLIYWNDVDTIDELIKLGIKYDLEIQKHKLQTFNKIT